MWFSTCSFIFYIFLWELWKNIQRCEWVTKWLISRKKTNFLVFKLEYALEFNAIGRNLIPNESKKFRWIQIHRNKTPQDKSSASTGIPQYYKIIETKRFTSFQETFLQNLFLRFIWGFFKAQFSGRRGTKSGFGKFF